MKSSSASHRLSGVHREIDGLIPTVENHYGIKAIAAISTLAFAGLIAVNIMARFGYFDTRTLSIINISTMGTLSLMALGVSRKMTHDSRSPDYFEMRKLALQTASFVLVVCAGLSVLGLYRVFNTTSLTWTVFAPAVAFGSFVLNHSILSNMANFKSRKRENVALAAFWTLFIGIIVINALAMKGYLNAQTAGIIDTAYFGSMGLIFSAVAHKVKKVIPKDATIGDKDKFGYYAALVFAIITCAIAGLTALGIPGVFSTTGVGWSVFGPMIGVPSLLLLAAIAKSCENGCPSLPSRRKTGLMDYTPQDIERLRAEVEESMKRTKGEAAATRQENSNGEGMRSLFGESAS